MSSSDIIDVNQQTTSHELEPKLRNVNTQHGDGNKVDEENIVVLRICLSPQPEVDENAEVIWFEEFVPPSKEDQVSAYYSKIDLTINWIGIWFVASYPISARISILTHVIITNIIF